MYYESHNKYKIFSKCDYRDLWDWLEVPLLLNYGGSVDGKLSKARTIARKQARAIKRLNCWSNVVIEDIK